MLLSEAASYARAPPQPLVRPAALASRELDAFPETRLTNQLSGAGVAVAPLRLHARLAQHAARSVAPPTTVTQPVRSDILLNGAQANFISGSLGSTQISTFNFFDILDVRLRTGTAADKVTITEPGLAALGLRNFSVSTGAGDDQLDVRSTRLTPPGLGSFDPAGGGGPLYVPAQGRFSFDGGTDNDTLTVAADADWSLRGDRVVANDRQTLELLGIEAAALNGGDPRLALRNFDAALAAMEGETAHPQRLEASIGRDRLMLPQAFWLAGRAAQA
jgi:hypothetical protein